MTDTIETRVARGVALLDEKLPGWWQRIDLARLNLGSPCNCILGQEFASHEDVDGDWWTGYEVAQDVLLDYRDATTFGFDLKFADSCDFPSLTAEWKRVILARRGGEAA